MKTDLYIGLTAITLLSIINIIGGLINDSLGHYYGIDEVLNSIIIFPFFGFFYWLTSLWKIRIRKSFRFPIIRAIIWLIIAIPIIKESQGAMASADLIDAVIPHFCVLITMLALYIKDYDWLSEIRFPLWGIMIIGVSIYQILILEVSKLIIKKITSHNKK